MALRSISTSSPVHSGIFFFLFLKYKAKYMYNELSQLNYRKSTASMNTFPCGWVNLNKQGICLGNPYTMETLWLRILCHYSTCIRNLIF